VKSQRVFKGGFTMVDRLKSGRKRATEVVRTKPGRYSVAFLIYVPKKDCVILVEQDRSAMIMDDNPTGTIEEVPAGRIERLETPAVVIAREASEEVGAAITVGQVRMLNAGQPLAVSPGVLDEMMYLGYVKLRAGQLSPDRVFGLPSEGERIYRRLVRVEHLPFKDYEDLKTFALVQWFLREHGGNKGRK